MCYVSKNSKTWKQWLPLAKWWFNSTYHNSKKLTPFKALYGYPPSGLLTYILETAKSNTVDEMLKNRTQILHLLKKNLKVAQNHMKTFLIRSRTESEFKEGD